MIAHWNQRHKDDPAEQFGFVKVEGVPRNRVAAFKKVVKLLNGAEKLGLAVKYTIDTPGEEPAKQPDEAAEDLDQSEEAATP